MSTDPFTGNMIPPGATIVRCPHGHVHLADSWQAAGNRCCYPGCTYVGDPARPRRTHRLRWFFILLAIIGVCTYSRWYSSVFSPSPFPSPEPTLVEPTIASSSVESNVVQPAPDISTLEPEATNDPIPAIFFTIERFFAIKRDATRTLDGSAYSEVTAGDELQKRLDALDTLRAKGCYWELASQPSIQFEQYQFVNSNNVRVWATIQEDANLYCTPNPNPDPGSYHDPYRMRFDLQRIDGNWYITNREALD